VPAATGSGTWKSVTTEFTNPTGTGGRNRTVGRANDVFHQVIQEAAGNDVLRLTLTHLHRNFRRDLSRIVLGESWALLRKTSVSTGPFSVRSSNMTPRAVRAKMVRHARNAGRLVVLRVERRAPLS
jgi:DNA-binding GntR family transcriptional regulator